MKSSLALYILISTMVALGSSMAEADIDSLHDSKLTCLKWATSQGLKTIASVHLFYSDCMQGEFYKTRINFEAQDSISQAPPRIQSLVLKIVAGSCDDNGVVGKSNALHRISAKDRAAQLGIPVEDAIQVNAALMKLPNSQCRQEFAPPTMQRENQTSVESVGTSI